MSADAESTLGPPRLFAFDQSDAALSLLPLCSRRALDLAGVKLSLEAYQRFDLGQRQQLARYGSAPVVDVGRVVTLTALVEPEVKRIDPVLDPDADHVPLSVSSALGDKRPLADKVWQSLTHLERYAFMKVATRSNELRLFACYEELVGQKQFSTHLRPAGGVVMVSIAQKAETQRMARAETRVTMTPRAYERLVAAQVPKGDVLATARLAGIMATKKTAELIPLCHPLALQHADLDFELEPQVYGVRIECKVEVFGRTGVEMEAMVGASVAALTMYDMLKSLDRGLVIGPTRLLEKSGGRSGHFDPDSSPSHQGSTP